jgi:tetratricopeptide (TPR) repeat protein
LKAVKYFKKGIEIDPLFSENYNGLGVVYNSMKNYEKAIESYTKAIEINGHDADYFHNLAAANKNSKDYESATLYYKKALEVDPDHYLSLEGLAKIYHHAGKLKEAIEYY